MVEVTSVISLEILQVYNSFLSVLPLFVQKFISFFLIVLLIVIYSIFIWKFYRFIAKKNIIQLNLNQYNKSQHPFFEKLIAAGLYFVEYILLLPLAVFVWFAIFTLFLIFLTEDLSVSSILSISATIIAAIRMISYYKYDLAKDLAKLLPFTLLAISITKPGFFDVGRIITNISQLPVFFNEIFYYLIFIIILEIILRTFEMVFSLFGLEEEEEVEK